MTFISSSLRPLLISRHILKAKHRIMSSSSSKDRPPPPKWLEPNLEEIKAQFRSLEGGQIALSQDEASGIAYLFLDHKDKKNSLSGKMMVDLNDAVTKLENWETGKGLILHSDGDMFCSGGYLETVKKILEPGDGYRMACLMHDSVLRIRKLPLVSVAVVQGKALGGGTELMLATDFRLFTPSTEIAFVQAKMSITTGWAGATLLKNLVGHTKALDYLLTGRKILPDESLRTGLCDHIVQDNATRSAESVEWLNSRIQHLSTTVVRATKHNIVCDSFEEERQTIGALWGSDAHREKLGANIKHK